MPGKAAQPQFLTWLWSRFCSISVAEFFILRDWKVVGSFSAEALSKHSIPCRDVIGMVASPFCTSAAFLDSRWRPMLSLNSCASPSPFLWPPLLPPSVPLKVKQRKICEGKQFRTPSIAWTILKSTPRWFLLLSCSFFWKVPTGYFQNKLTVNPLQVYKLFQGSNHLCVLGSRPSAWYTVDAEPIFA